MKKLFLILLFVLVSPSVGLAQRVAPAPEVSLQGYISYKGDERAILSTRYGSRLVREGQWLGDYRIVSIDVHSGIIYDIYNQPVYTPWRHGSPTLEDTKWNSRYSLRLDNAETVYVLKALAEIQELNFYCSNEVSGAISYAGVLKPEEAMTGILSALPGATIFQDHTSLIVGSPSTIERVKQALTARAPTQKRVTIDFVQAQLSYVLSVLGEEMNRKVELGLQKEGGVTISAEKTSAYNLFLVCLALQDIPYEVVQESATFRVVPTTTYSY